MKKAKPAYIVSDSKNRAKELLKDEMNRRGVSNAQLAELLVQSGVKESSASIANKLSRGTFSASFMMNAMSVMGANSIPLKEPKWSHVLREDSIQQALWLGSESQQKAQFVGIHENSRTGMRWIDVSNNRGLTTSYPKKVISLFSGAGGLDIGLEQAGFETSVCVEIDADCRATLRKNRPEWKVYEDASGGRAPGDIKTVRASELLEAAKLDVGEAALVVGGAPCQAFSNIGKRQGVSDVENGGDLFAHFVRIVKGVLPHAFIFENVAGITQSKHAEVISFMNDQFKGLGYGLAGAILNSANYGVPQKRERFIFIGMRGVANPCLPLPTHHRDEHSWKNFISDLAPFVNHSVPSWVTVKEAFDAIPASLRKRPDYTVMNISDFVRDRMHLIKQGENFHVLPMQMRPRCWQTGKHQGQDTFGRLRLDQPSVTIRTAAYNPAKGRYIHPLEHRGLSSHEMAALQGFPKEWEFFSAKYDKIPLVSVGRQIGNAVPPLLGRAVGLAIRKQLLLCSEY